MGFLKHSVLAQNIVATFIETCREPDYSTNNFVTGCKNNSKLTLTIFLVFHLKKLRAISEQTCLLRKYRFGTQFQFYVVYKLTCIVNTQFQISKNDQFSYWIWIYRRTSVKCLHSLISIINAAVTRIRTWVTSATTKGTNHYTITALMATYNLYTRILDIDNCRKMQNMYEGDIVRVTIFTILLMTNPRIDYTMKLCNNIIFLQIIKWQSFD